MRSVATTTTAAAAALAAAAATAGFCLSLIGPQHVEAFAPAATFRGSHATGSDPTAAWSSILEASPEVAASAEVAAPPPASAATVPSTSDKPKAQPKQPQQQQKQKQKKKSPKSTKVTPQASSASSDGAKSAKTGKRRKTKRGKRGGSGKSTKSSKNAAPNAAAKSAKSNKRTYKSALGDATKSKHGNDLWPLSNLRLGQSITGYVAAITDFGAFLKTDFKLEGGKGGSKRKGGPGSGYALLHISQISDERVENVGDVLKIGQEIQGLRVIDINYAKGEVGLSLRTKRPSRFPLSKVSAGDEMEGKVKSVVPYGAFIDVGCTVNALLHVSRMSTDNDVINPRDVVNEGDYMKVHIIDVDATKKTLACSILDSKADEYLDRRRRQLDRRYADRQRGAQSTANRAVGRAVNQELHEEVAYFEEALLELENAFKN